MKAKVWLISWLVIVISVLGAVGYVVYKVDPFIHFHAPDLDEYYYTLDNQRSQNDGLSEFLEFDALITGTSMTDNFKTSEMDALFGCHSAKLTFDGGTFVEINDFVERVLKRKPDLSIVLRGLDLGCFLDKYDWINVSEKQRVGYLTGDNAWNDVEYLLNEDAFFGRALTMMLDKGEEGFEPGITSFDEYSRWQEAYGFGYNSVYPDGITFRATAEEGLSEEQRAVIEENITRNVTSIADRYPEVEFYYFYTPYSLGWWGYLVNCGLLTQWLEAEKQITELILPHENIHLFSFNNRRDITADLNNYTDPNHYAAWVNSLILKWIHDGSYQLTADNYEEYLEEERMFLAAVNYSLLKDQIDYENDLFAAALVNRELTGAEPLDVLNDDRLGVELVGASFLVQDGRNTGVSSQGWPVGDGFPGEGPERVLDDGFVGVKFTVSLDEGYRYLCFDGQKDREEGMPVVLAVDEEGNAASFLEANDIYMDCEKHQYVIDLASAGGTVTVFLGGTEGTAGGGPDTEYLFSNVVLY